MTKMKCSLFKVWNFLLKSKLICNRIYPPLTAKKRMRLNKLDIKKNVLFYIFFPLFKPHVKICIFMRKKTAHEPQSLL